MHRAFRHGFYTTAILAAVAVFTWPASARAGYIPLPNPGFELDVNNDGYPDQWVVGFGPILDKSGAQSRSGQSAVKINANARIVTDVAPPNLTGLTLRGWMRADVPAGHAGALELQQYVGSTFIDQTTRSHNLTSTYSQYGVNLRPLPGITRILPLFRSTSGQTWVWFDDMDLLTDSIDNGSLESIANGAPSAWTIAGMPTLDTIGGASPQSPTAVVCNRDNYFYQPIACSPTTRTYTLEFRVRAAEPAADSILIKWYDGRGQYFQKTEFPFSATANFTRVIQHFTAPPLAVWGEVALQPAESTWFWFDEIHLSFQNVEFPHVTPNGDEINDVPMLYYTLPYDAQTTVSLLSALGDLISVAAASPSLLPGTHAAPIDIALLQPLDTGAYQLRLDVARDGDAPWSNQWPISIRHIPAWDEQPAVAPGDLFAIGIWEYVFGGEFAMFSSFADLVGRAAQWNFNAVHMLFLKESDYETAYDAIDGSPIQAIMNNFPLPSFTDTRAWPSGFNEFGLAAVVADLAARFGDNPNWLALYLKDEPLRRDTENLRAAFRVSQNAAPAQLPISTFTVNADTASIAARTSPPVLMFDYYPVGFTSLLGPNEWAAFIPALNQMRGIAEDLGRPWWLTTQGFFNSAGRRPLVPAEQRAIVGLTAAHGARGIWYFIRSTFGGNEGMLDVDFEESELMPEIIAQNERLRRMETLLLSLQPGTLAITLDEPQCLAETFEDSRGVAYVFVVNKNTLLPRSCQIIAPLTFANQTANEARFGPDGRIATPLPSRIDGDEMTIALPPLAPGDWMIVEIGDAADIGS